VSGCVPPEEYVKLMGEVGFDGAKCVGIGKFWTSKTTRSMDFVGIKAVNTVAPRTTAVAPRAQSSSFLGLKPKHLVMAGITLLLALTLTRVASKRS